MSQINILSPHTADLIAAGEVVERPASVVKELIENSIDAGAKNITVEVTAGGMGSICVTDDGSGMSPEDAGIAFLRHATSKIADETSLGSIATLGFRGEALAAISAVSKIELKTRERTCDTGTFVSLTAGEIDSMGPVGCPVGTSMKIDSLFFNTPARLKFMKSDKAESSACLSAAMRCAMGHPEISIRMLRDGQELFFTPGDGSAKSAVYSILGRDIAMNMLELSSQADSICVSGFVSAPHAGRGNRSMQFFFVNGRAFKSLMLQTALENAFKNTLLTGRFPTCALYINLEYGKVDVNVHPTKQEVKFSEEKRVFDAVYYAILACLGSETKTAEILLSAPTQKVIEPQKDFYRQMSSTEYRSGYQPQRKTYQTYQLREDPAAYNSSHLVPKPDLGGLNTLFPGERKTAPAPQAPAREPFVQAPYRIIGEAMTTYIIVEREDELVLIDKHAAHERIIFDRLRANPADIMCQTLLVPETFSPSPRVLEILTENAAQLKECGYEFEIIGTGSVIIRALPADTEGSGASALEEIAEKLDGNIKTDLRDAILHTTACKAAIKAGRSSAPEELASVAEKVISGEVRYCPHGRPVSVCLTKKELDKQFMRIV